MTVGKVCPPKLAIVIHTEEEFDWNADFNVNSTAVTHGNELLNCVKRLSEHGAKTTLAMDYAFVNSKQGKACITKIKQDETTRKSIEFAAHLHPWVNPPWEAGEKDTISEPLSYPGNLSYEQEFAKLSSLTEKIKTETNSSPLTYLAGRYGIGKNTDQILKQLGYAVDVSISPFADFRHQHGPDFRKYNNNTMLKDGLLHWPHTSAVVSPFSFVRKVFNSSPSAYSSSALTMRLFKKLTRARLHRLSPEGFSLSDMQNVTRYQYALGQQCFILSFHSPSVKPGLTPYVTSTKQLEEFNEKIFKFVNWFKTSMNGEFITVKEHPKVQHD